MFPRFLLLTLYVRLHVVEVDLLESGMHVEQVGHEGQVELAVSVDDVLRGDKLPAVQLRRLLQHQLSPLGQIVLLQVRREEGGWVGIQCDCVYVCSVVCKKKKSSLTFRPLMST